MWLFDLLLIKLVRVTGGPSLSFLEKFVLQESFDGPQVTHINLVMNEE